MLKIPVKTSLIIATLVLSHGIAYHMGASLAHERGTQSKPASEPGAALSWLTPRAASGSLSVSDHCSALRTELAEAQSENESLNARFDDSNRIWRSIFLGPDAAIRSDDDEDSRGKTDNTDPVTVAANAATPPQDSPPMCVARCDRIQKWTSCGSPPS